MQIYPNGHWPAKTITFRGDELKFIVSLLRAYSSIAGTQQDQVYAVEILTRLLTRDDEKL